MDAEWILEEPVSCLESAGSQVVPDGETGNYATTVMCGFDANWGLFLGCVDVPATCICRLRCYT